MGFFRRLLGLQGGTEPQQEAAPEPALSDERLTVSDLQPGGPVLG